MGAACGSVKQTMGVFRLEGFINRTHPADYCLSSPNSSQMLVYCPLGEEVIAGWLRLVRGKSGLHRAGRWVTPRRGNPTESATEKIPPALGLVRVKWWGKSPPRDGRPDRHGKPRPEQCQVGEGGVARADRRKARTLW